MYIKNIIFPTKILNHSSLNITLNIGAPVFFPLISW